MTDAPRTPEPAPALAPHPGNVEALAHLLYRAEHWEIGVVPPFERLPAVRQDEFRRKARFLSARGVLVAAAVAEEVRRLLPRLAEAADTEAIRTLLEDLARGR
ncbi:MAG TPA: hypothetical protein VNK43_13405 [Gemmatimonadales bacterium]|nr:hypothetical protein [Gemmatimonadales bacterium]